MAGEYVFPVCGETNRNTLKLGVIQLFTEALAQRCDGKASLPLLCFSKSYSPSSHPVSNKKLFSKVNYRVFCLNYLTVIFDI